MDILQQIQGDIIKENITLSTVLRKAKVLSHQIKSHELGSWVSNELDGYESRDELPDYRILHAACLGTYTNGYWKIDNQIVPMYKIDNEELQEAITTFYVFEGIRSVELFAKEESLNISLPPEAIALVNSFVSQSGYSFINLKFALSPKDFDQILDTVKNLAT